MQAERSPDDPLSQAPETALDQITGSVRELTGIGADTQGKILATLAIILLLWLVRSLVLRFVWSRTEHAGARYRWRKSTTYAAVVLGLVLLSQLWLTGFGDLATFLGFLAAGLALALRDPISNMAGWLFIIWRRPFSVGDRVEIGEDRGDVIDQRLFEFTLLEIGNWVAADQSTGRIIHVPNGRVFRESLGNYTREFAYIWNEIPVLVTFESDWRKAKRILLEVAEQESQQLSEEAEKRILQASRRFMIFYSTLTPTVYTSAEASGIRLTIRYLSEPRRRRGGAEKIWEAILERFEAHDDIDFAYPTTRFYDNVVEGKPGAKVGSGDGKVEERA